MMPESNWHVSIRQSILDMTLAKNDEEQDRLWKFNIPTTERSQALKSLNKMNINSFSLFGSEDSLVESISTNEIIKNKL
jgi:hypothetical protein